MERNCNEKKQPRETRAQSPKAKVWEESKLAKAQQHGKTTERLNRQCCTATEEGAPGWLCHQANRWSSKGNVEFARQNPPVKSNAVSHGWRSSVRDEQRDTVSVGLLAVTTEPVSGAGKGTCPFARSCSATCLLSLHQELSLPVASKGEGSSTVCRADFYPGPSSRHLKQGAHNPYSPSTHTNESRVHKFSSDRNSSSSILLSCQTHCFP